MFESDECLFDIDDHVEVYLAALIIPVKVNAKVALS